MTAEELDKLALEAYPIEKDPSEEAKNALAREGFKKGWLKAASSKIL